MSDRTPVFLQNWDAPSTIYLKIPRMLYNRCVGADILRHTHSLSEKIMIHSLIRSCFYLGQTDKFGILRSSMQF